MSLYSALIPAVASLGGAAIGAISNSSASKSTAKALKKANKIRQQALNQAQTIYEEQRDQAAPAVAYLRDVISNPGAGLYPDQIAAQQEARRQSENQIARSGLRGSGRAVTASLKEVDSDFVNKALAQNRNNRMGAANSLAGESFRAGSNAANAMISGGDAAANTQEQIGINSANTGTANAQLWGGALGDIGSLIASEVKGRPSSYEGEDIFGRKDQGTISREGPYDHLNAGGVVKKRGLHGVTACA